MLKLLKLTSKSITPSVHETKKTTKPENTFKTPHKIIIFMHLQQSQYK